MRSEFSKNGKTADQLRQELFANIQVGHLPECSALVNPSCSGTIQTDRFQTNISVIPEGTIQASVKLHRGIPEAKIGILNFASYKTPGGGFMAGAMAQEEAICYCTNLYPALVAESGYYEAHKSAGLNGGFYSNSSLLTRDVTVLCRDVDDYLDLQDRFTIDVLTCAAPNLRYSIRRGEKDSPIVVKTIRSRIEYLLRVFALHTNLDYLVLGAFGCGVFRNDPTVVAKSFQDVLMHECRGVFRNVVFAIPNSGASANNYRVFSEVLCNS